MKNLFFNLELREEVAIAAGWTDTKIRVPYPLRCLGTSPQGEPGCYLPEFDRSIDAILREFDKQDWDYDFKRYTHADGLTEYKASSLLLELSYTEVSPAIALCKLFLAISAKEKNND